MERRIKERIEQGVPYLTIDPMSLLPWHPRKDFGSRHSAL